MNIDLGGQNLVNLTSKNIKDMVFTNDCTCACSILYFYLLFVNGNAQNGCFLFVKRYAVREAIKWRYAVRKAKIGRYAVRKGGGGCHSHVLALNVTGPIPY